MHRFLHVSYMCKYIYMNCVNAYIIHIYISGSMSGMGEVGVEIRGVKMPDNTSPCA